MLLGLHSYSLYLHGIGENWGEFVLPWPKQMDIWQLMDYLMELGLEGLHVDDAQVRLCPIDLILDER